MTETSSSFAHLHARSWYSFRRGGSSPDALVEQARINGDVAIAVTDYMSVAGCVPLQAAARAANIQTVIGAEVNLEGFPLVLLAANNAGFATINRLISRGFERQEEFITLEELHDDSSVMNSSLRSKPLGIRRLIVAKPALLAAITTSGKPSRLTSAPITV